MTLHSAYDEIMDKIIVTDEMRDRILHNIQSMDLKKERPKMVHFLDNPRKVGAAAACFAVFLIGAASFYAVQGMGPKEPSVPFSLPGTELPELGVPGTELPDTESPGTSLPETVVGDQMPGIAEAASVQELAELVGFAVADINGLPFEVQEVSYLAYQHWMAEIIYSGSGQEAVFRKTVGTEDNSGDYNDYPEIIEAVIGDRGFILKGSERSYTLAVWSDEEYSYSIYLTQGVTREVWEEIIAGDNVQAGE